MPSIPIPLVTKLGFRTNSQTKDSKMVNCYKEGNFVVKRPGKSTYTVTPSLTPTGQGLWVFNGNLYAASNGVLYKITGGTRTTVGSLASTTNEISWTNVGGTTAPNPYMVLHDGVNGYAVNAAGVMTTLPVSFPTNPVYGLVNLDGYVFAMDTYGQIWQSDEQNPLIWGALNYLTANYEPDSAVALSKHLNYVIAFKQWSTEFYYDNGNAVGSVLLPNLNATIEVGCAHGNSVQQLEQSVIWMSNVREGGRQIMMLTGLAPQPLSTKPVESFLNASNLSSVYSWIYKIAGHTFYGLILVDQDITLVYDIQEKDWHIWTTSKANIGGGEGYFECTFVENFPVNSNVWYVLDAITGNVYNISPTNYVDPFGPITVRIVSERADAGVHSRKTLSRFTLFGDSVADTITYSQTDDDYATWSTPKTIDLSLQRPCLYNLGSFRRRAFQLLYTGSNPLRLEKAFLDVTGPAE